MMKIAYSYWMKDDPDRVRAVAPEHAAYWRDLGLPGYLGGPFADRSGGLITFEADSLEQAEDIIAADPFVREDLLERSVRKQWMRE
jgi:uncharacterized protein YciI